MFYRLSFFILSISVFSAFLQAQNAKSENLIIITLDGFRWQELFSGADSILISNKNYVSDSAGIRKDFWANTAEARRKKLMPFFWNVIAEKGQLHGNRTLGSKVNVKNPYLFSYPGYNEIFSGYPDVLVNSNDKNMNQNVTVLEYFNKLPEFKGKVAAFTSWDVFDAIFNEKRAGFPVSAGFDKVKIDNKEFDLLNEMQQLSPKPFGDEVRTDMLTYFMAKEYLKKNHPRILYIGFDETDDYAHQGKYDNYLESARLTDDWIADLWKLIQTIPFYKDKTCLLITSDHGRGDIDKSQWQSHGSKIQGANEIWFTAIGAGIKAKGEIKESEQLYQSQIAQTIAKLLRKVYQAKHPIDEAMKEIF